MIRRPPRSPLFPYPPFFRSGPFRRNRFARRDSSVVALSAKADPGRAVPGGARVTRDAHRLELPDQDRLWQRSEEHTSELQSPDHLVCRLLLEKKKDTITRSN